MSKIRIAPVLFLSSVVQIACSKPDLATGEWKATAPEGSGMKNLRPSKFIVERDGKFMITDGATTYSGTWVRSERGIVATATMFDGKSTAGMDDMTMEFKLSEDGKKLVSDENPIVWIKAN